MKAEHQLVAKASQMRAALELVAPKSRKRRPPRIPVALCHDPVSGQLSISNAGTGARGREMPASGTWPARLQVDGAALRRLCDTIPGRDELTLIALPAHLVVLYGGARVQLRRIDADGSKGIPDANFRPNLRRKRPPPETGQHRTDRSPKGETWSFSAQVPFPRKPDDSAS